MNRAEMNVADSAHYGIDFANLAVHFANAADVFDVHVHIAAGSANADDFMPSRQRVYRRFANGAGGAYDNYFHHDILSDDQIQKLRHVYGDGFAVWLYDQA